MTKQIKILINETKDRRRNEKERERRREKVYKSI